MTPCQLRDLPVGGTARVLGIKDTHRSYRSKLLSMGLTRGTPLFVRRIAPFGDPIHISVRDYDLSLRRDEADALVLECADDEAAGRGGRHHRRRRVRGPRAHHHHGGER